MRKVMAVRPSPRSPSRKRVARRCWSCTSSIPRRKLSTLPAPGRRMRWARRSSNWTSFSSRWARAWDGHEVGDLAVGRLALHYAEENPDEVVAAFCGPTRPSSTSLATRPTEVVSSCASDLTHLFARYSTLEHYRLPEPTLHRPKS